MILHSLFPTPVGKFELGREFTAEEIECYKSQTMSKNIGNKSSENRYVLNHETMSTLKEYVQSCVDNYFDSIYAPKNEVKLKITQSWFNYSKPGEWHHKHEHPNSFISGVLYMKAAKNSDRIYFYSDSYKQIHIPAKNFNLYNSSSWWIPVETGDLMMFPSSFTHSVEPVQGDDERISLAFNTFPVGYVGQEEGLTALYLRD